jgi:hypothetical protein
MDRPEWPWSLGRRRGCRRIRRRMPLLLARRTEHLCDRLEIIGRIGGGGVGKRGQTGSSGMGRFLVMGGRSVAKIA